MYGHAGRVRAAALSPDGRLVASAGVDTTVRLWDAATGDLVQVMRGHSGRVHRRRWRPGCATGLRPAADFPGGLIAADATARPASPAPSSKSVAWHPDGTILCTIGGAGTYPSPTGRRNPAETARPFLLTRSPATSCWRMRRVIAKLRSSAVPPNPEDPSMVVHLQRATIPRPSMFNRGTRNILTSANQDDSHVVVDIRSRWSALLLVAGATES
jgi:hypothetical protein